MKYRVVAAKIIEISTLLLGGFKKTDILKQLKVSRRNVHCVEQHLKASESIRKTKGYMIRTHQKRPSKTTHARKWQDWHRRKKIQSSQCLGMVKNMGENSKML